MNNNFYSSAATHSQQPSTTGIDKRLKRTPQETAKQIIELINIHAAATSAQRALDLIGAK